MAQRIFKVLRQVAMYLVLLMVISASVDWWRAKDIPKIDLPDLVGTTIQGESVNLKVMSKDQPVMLYFWGSWCGVCNFVSPSVDTISEYFPVMTVALSSGSKLAVTQYLKDNDYHFPVLNDPDYKVGSEWAVQVTPSIVVVKNGQVEHIATGFVSLFGMWWRMYFA
ncbi:protein disulfide oxidoreductase [Litoribacillus peritrichatus]|uniref:Protein disulfide oxidoreductase n=1 Tax=Litoribacillus peritrichatus TaxID=718191 RepID=A0ABP7N408_9GAMM